jgi:hypothetical protein
VITDLDRIVGDFATALKAVDGTGPQDRMKRYRPGVGPLTEADAVKEALNYLKHSNPEIYEAASPRPYPGTQQKCDLVIPGAWAIEFKLIRPFGDNGKEAEHWSENILHPYPGNTSSIGDCLKLRDSAFRERKAIIVFGFEHTPPVIDLEVAVKSFEVIAVQVVGINLSTRYSAGFTDLMHPYHQQGKVLGWEILQAGM